MKKIIRITSLLLVSFMFFSAYGNDFEKDVIKTSGGDLEITFINHGTLMMVYKNLVIHIDPVAGYTDYTRLPKADIILVTHHHGDHLNADAINLLKKENTTIILTETCFSSLKEGTILANGESEVIDGINIEAVPAYNLVNKRDNGEVFHPKGIGNGYVVNFSDLRVYIGGDTENFPEMKDLKNIDIAFLPMNLPYTMTPQMVAEAVSVIQPGILYPYHYGNTDTSELINLLKENKSTEIRIRKMN